MSQIEKDRILELMRIIEKNLKIINDKNIKNVEILRESTDIYYIVSMALFNILNKAIELGDEIIDIYDLGFPTKYSQIPQILFENKILDKSEYKLFKNFVDYRNYIAHEYDEIKVEEIFWCIENLDFIKKFMKIVKNKIIDEI